MFKQLKLLILTILQKQPEYNTLRNKLIKLKIELKQELKELYKDLQERNDSRKKKFINEMVSLIIIGFILWFICNILLLKFGYSDIKPIKLTDLSVLEKSFIKQDWAKKYFFYHDNEDDMRKFAGKIYKQIKNKDLQSNNDKVIIQCLKLWRHHRKNWDKNFIVFQFPFELPQKQNKPIINKKKSSLMQMFIDFYKNKKKK